MKYYVYIGKIDDIIVYIGKGSGKRYLHLNSGTSHSYNANAAHFQGKLISVDIIKYFDTSEEAISYESHMIDLHKPKWNYQVSGIRVNPLRRKPVREHKGVQFVKNKSSKQWRAYTHIDTVKVHIGYFDTEEEAKEARSSYQR